MAVTEVNGHPVDPEVTAAVEQAARLLESLGHHVSDSHPEAMADPAYLDRWVDSARAWPRPSTTSNGAPADH